MDFEASLGRKVGVLNRQLSRRMGALLAQAGTGITVDQFRLLTVLWKSDGITQQELASQVGRDRASVTRMVDILEAQGLLARVADQRDRRTNLLCLLKPGRDLEATAAACAQRALDEMTRGFTRAEAASFSALLDRAITNLKK